MDGRNTAVALALAATSLLGCAGMAWRDARRADTIAAYHDFLRDFPTSPYSDEARARIDLSRIKRHPTRAGVETFRARYSTPDLIAELDPLVEDLLFEHARAIGTPAAYRAFLERYPSGALTSRAEGNLAYLEGDGFGDDLEALARFAAEHPTSDYAAEAARSVESVKLRNVTGFGRVGVVIDVDPSTPGAERLRRAFRARADTAYTAAGIATAPLADRESARDSDVAALLTIRHDERATSAELEKGRVAAPAIVAHTEVELERLGRSRPIWSDSFEYRAPPSARRDDVSIVFNPASASSYWADPDGQFFVPIARWSTETSARPPLALSKHAIGVDVSGSRAVVVFGDGDFQAFDLGDPERLVLLAEYHRDRDLARFEGVRIEGSKVAVFGADGVELVELDGEDARREQAWGRDRVGSVVAAESVDGSWLLATNRGLLQLDAESDQVRTLIARPILGMARGPDARILFTDGISLSVASLPELQAGRVASELHLGRGFAPQRIRASGRTAVVLGARDAVWVDSRSAPPRLLSRINGRDTGRILDASIIGDRVFVIGPRGLQVMDPSGQRVVDSVDVDARRRIESEGRHLVILGEKTLQVVDATPFVATTPASAEH
jgi:hypothetical protein